MALLSPAAWAQGALAASETHIDIARGLNAGGGNGSSSSFLAEVSLGVLSGGLSASSPNFDAIGGIVSVTGPLQGPPPMVLSVLQAEGDHDGGEVVSVQGINFDQLGSGAPDVRFGGVSASSVLLNSDTEIQATTPAGNNAFGNSLGLVDVEVENLIGASTLEDGYLYLPALLQVDTAQIGQSFDVRLHTVDGGFGLVWVGLPIAGISVPLFPYDGALVAFDSLVFLTGLFPTTNGELTATATLPNNPNWIGLSLPLQALAVESLDPLAGAFTSVLNVPIFP